MRSKLLFFSVVWVVFIGLALKRISDDPVQSDDRVPASTRNLYERIGGRDAINQWGSELAQLVGADLRMMTNKQFKVLWSGANQAQLRKAFLDYLCERTQGPCRYSGPTLKKVFDPMVFGKMEWVYLKEAYLLALRKSRPDLGPEDRAQLEKVFDETQAIAAQE